MNELFLFDREQNVQYVIGTDEAGRGPAAGGVFASAVCFTNYNDSLIKDLSKLNDSKKLTQQVRSELFDIINKNTINSTVCIEVDEIEKINILRASLKAMKLACETVLAKLGTNSVNSITLVDGSNLIREYNYPQKTIIKGDSKSASIAAASILAKVSRDRYMSELDKKYPMYGWANNAGYLTSDHLEAIDKFGLCEFHRKSFLERHAVEQLSLFTLS